MSLHPAIPVSYTHLDVYKRQLEAFVAVVENKSFSEAARQLNLTQPTISAHIQTLEQMCIRDR